MEGGLSAIDHTAAADPAAQAWQTLRVRRQDTVCFVQFHRPEANNAIDHRLLSEFGAVLDMLDASVTVLVLEGLPEVFCFGADFAALREATLAGPAAAEAALEPERLYALWTRLATGPFVVVSYVRGKANAGGLGFVAASDIVIADDSAVFSLSELLFGLMPACVMPFLVRRIGFQRAHYMTLMTQPIGVEQAAAWGLVDAWEADGASLLRRHLLRLRRLSREALMRYKRFYSALEGSLEGDRARALAANREVFGDPANLKAIVRYVEAGAFPWERD
ncbi:enoyl-CoA hydratase/isomerase [Burkholderia gladioli]|uniref:Polyketide biosynthesis enoyl-CoA hydratase n=1 Tax=Burkholderia gladioli (strain BSR3) TaxID=999541 RepID=F2LA04_BURGS|nr:enoyl-CoA hydratase/isomerase [Burkholderia gladioli]AEA60788.1 polyketide biosynthesis enoyl-CoA hydratase [Burkholderia gladioli BSR3]MBW5280797.1 enoyl-CoA hydratase/isomerase [Burkholderia gladioli]MDA0576168.1 enoyl-CoA hydratase/isomerase [Burkholderia gladioli]MDA0604262.1 enoyl-CoA hydratase/isomerase [Burkholderia gladioli]